MRKLAIAAAAAATLLTAVPAMAAGFYVGPGGVGVDVGPGYYAQDCDYYNNWCGSSGYYDYYGGPNVVIGGGWHGSHFHGGGGHFHHR
jgi:hypothetical protein